MSKKLVSVWYHDRLKLGVAVAAALIAGLGLLAVVRADTFMVDGEAEAGDMLGAAVKIADAGASGGDGVQFGTACSVITGSDNAQIGFNFFVSRGFTTEQSAGIIGNLMQESHMDPTAVQLGGGPGRGIAQWSVGARWQDLLDWKGSRDEWALDTQLDFIIHELQTTEKATVPALKATTTVHDATYQFEIKYERAGTPNFEARYKYADEAFAAFAATAPPVGCAGDITTTQGAGYPNIALKPFMSRQASSITYGGLAELTRRGIGAKQVEAIVADLAGKYPGAKLVTVSNVQHAVERSAGDNVIHDYSFDVLVDGVIHPAKLMHGSGAIEIKH